MSADSTARTPDPVVVTNRSDADEAVVTGDKWAGATCCMCNGTGRDFSYVTEPTTGGVRLVVARVENGRRCRACNGHGRDAR